MPDVPAQHGGESAPQRIQRQWCGPSADRVDGSPGQQFALLFPVWLAANPDERVEYLALKHDAMAAAPATSGEYADAKEPWLAGAYRRAWAWADQTGWRT